MTTSQTAYVALALAALALIVAVVAGVRLGALRRRLAGLAESEDADVVTLLTREREQTSRLSREVAALRQRVDSVDGSVASGLRHVAVVRYDAFGDMGGRLSFSAALLDDAGDGLVLSSIHARGESRTYAKGIISGASEVTLTPEEQQALAAARSDRPDA